MKTVLLIAISLMICSIHAYELPLVVIIPSYNNEKYCVKNLESVFMQKYENYRVIYVNDTSTDETLRLVQECIMHYGQQARVTIVNNMVRLGTLANIYTAVHMCSNNEIVIDLDGDDYLAHDKVLQRINEAYQSTGAWVIYSQHMRTNGVAGLSEPFPSWVIERNTFRRYRWVSSHLRTFYAKLFKQIKVVDLMHEGDFFQVTSDQAFMFPLLEMAGKHIYFLNEVLYIYNVANPLNDAKVRLKQAENIEKIIRERALYFPLNEDEFAAGKR